MRAGHARERRSASARAAHRAGARRRAPRRGPGEGRHALDSRVGTSPRMQRADGRRCGEQPQATFLGDDQAVCGQSLARAVAQLEPCRPLQHGAGRSARGWRARAARATGARRTPARQAPTLSSPATAAYPQTSGKPPQARPNHRSEEATAEEFEVVREDEEQPDRDEQSQPWLERDRADEPMPHAAAIEAAASPTRTLSGMPFAADDRAARRAHALRCRRRGRTRRRHAEPSPRDDGARQPPITT